MRVLCLILVVICTFSLFAQTAEKAVLKCVYLEDYVRFLEEPDNRRQDEWVLELGRNSSAFYGIWERKQLQLRDSLSAQGASLAEIQSAQAQHPRSHQYGEIYKNYPRRGKMTEIDKLIKFFLVEEDMPDLKWEIEDEEREVAEYVCRKAVTSFGNRTWYAWFTPEIPISDGPWKLCGLPGLILEAEDSEGHYHFRCVEIQVVEEEDTPLWIQPLKQNYIRCSHSELQKNRVEQHTDLNGFIRKMMGITVQTLQTTPEVENRVWNYIER